MRGSVGEFDQISGRFSDAVHILCAAMFVACALFPVS